MFEEDEVLKKHPYYEDIKIYASEYLSQLNTRNMESSSDGNFLNAKEQKKTIDKIFL